MLHRLRSRAGRQEGFTLVELLVVVLIIGILAAIAIPTFLGQKDKANDGAAKSLLTTGVTAMETFYTDNQTYVGADGTTMKAIEPSIAWTTTAGGLTSANAISISGLSASNYTLTTTISANKVYAYAKTGTTISKTCTGSDCKSGTW
jgi:type IV pilus assembly protein PilA